MSSKNEIISFGKYVDRLSTFMLIFTVIGTLFCLYKFSFDFIPSGFSSTERVFNPYATANIIGGFIINLGIWTAVKCAGLILQNLNRPQDE